MAVDGFAAAAAAPRKSCRIIFENYCFYSSLKISAPVAADDDDDDDEEEDADRAMMDTENELAAKCKIFFILFFKIN